MHTYSLTLFIKSDLTIFITFKSCSSTNKINEKNEKGDDVPFLNTLCEYIAAPFALAATTFPLNTLHPIKSDESNDTSNKNSKIINTTNSLQLKEGSFQLIPSISVNTPTNSTLGTLNPTPIQKFLVFPPIHLPLTAILPVVSILSDEKSSGSSGISISVSKKKLLLESPGLSFGLARDLCRDLLSAVGHCIAW